LSIENYLKEIFNVQFSIKMPCPNSVIGIRQGFINPSLEVY